MNTSSMYFRLLALTALFAFAVTFAVASPNLAVSALPSHANVVTPIGPVPVAPSNGNVATPIWPVPVPPSSGNVAVATPI